MLFYQLLRPVAGYLQIQHPTKRFADWILPCILAGITTALMYLANGKLNLYGNGGLINLVLGYVQNLPGFYIAALAAIATFARPDIDMLMPGDPPPRILVSNIVGQTNLVQLTRRRFLCLMFAFLTAECIFLTLLSILLLSAAPPMRDFLGPFFYAPAFSVATFVYFTILFQLLVTTLWGLYYLGERIHQP